MRTRLFLLILLSVTIVSSQSLSPLERQLKKDIMDGRLDSFSHIKAAFILSGVRNTDSLQTCLQWYNNLIQTIESFDIDAFDRVNSAAKVFSYLHTTWLQDYRERSTTLLDVVRKKQYNCVAGTILYNLVCESLGWHTEAFETPTHTYTIFPNFGQNLIVENTTSYGFDILNNLQQYSKYLAQFYPSDKVYQIGLDRLYEYENSKGRVITNTELLGLLAYNRAYFAEGQKNYDQAYEFVRLAQYFNRDSRSNINFEINLYNVWGKQLFDSRQFHRAFELYADAYYRYWDIEAFAHNCKASFFNAASQDWQHKRWSTSVDLYRDIKELELLQSEDRYRVSRMLKSWITFFERNGNERGKNRAIELLKTFD